MREGSSLQGPFAAVRAGASRRPRLSLRALRGHAPAGGGARDSLARSELDAPPLFTHTSELIVARDVDLRLHSADLPLAEIMRDGPRMAVEIITTLALGLARAILSPASYFVRER